jgi:hypothetical protein
VVPIIQRGKARILPWPPGWTLRLMAAKTKKPRVRRSASVPRPILDVLLAVYRATAGRPHHQFYISVDDLRLPLNQERADAAIMLAVQSGLVTAGGDPAHSVALTEAGRGLLRQRRMID